ncbi:hypothetical protein HYV10_02200 [Candidatus Dependentiae bacterium]|nr:hypothetical protein [Candidatus Dependentiae bacterium]
MKKKIFILILILESVTHFSIYAVSVVYNFRIAQITRQPITKQAIYKNNAISWLLFNFFQKNKFFHIRENYTGGLLTFNRNFCEKYYFRTDFAAAHTNQTVKNTLQVNETEPDDILCTMGRNFILNQNSRVTLSALLGIPTHSVNTLKRVDFGTGQVGTGLQLDGLYKIFKKADFLCGTRYVYFIPRTAFDAQDNSYKFTVGSIADILVSLKTNNTLGHGLEGGYAARWGFGINALPHIPKLKDAEYMRNNFFLVYKYTFLTERVANRLLLNISYGFDSKPKDKGYYAIMIWASWGIAF